MSKKVTSKKVKIDAEKFYSPLEVVNMGVILNTSMLPCRFTLYRLLRNKTIKAIKIGSGTSKARYKVQGKDLLSFINTR